MRRRQAAGYDRFVARLLSRSLAFAVVLLGVVAAVLWFTPSDHYIFLPDPAKPVDPLVSIPDEGADDETGGIYFLEVFIRKASVLERIFPGLRDGASLVAEDVYNPRGLSFEERRRESLNEMSASQQIAIAVALRSLNYDVPARGAEVTQVREGFPAEGKLEVGDVIVKARGRTVTSPRDLFQAMRGLEPGHLVTVTILHSGKTRELAVGTGASPDDPGRAIMGIVVQPELEFPIDVRINAGDVGGPSAGLAFALDVVDELGRDVDAGRRIAATGVLDLDGRISTIGGIKQKTIGAEEAGADIFVVPKANAAAARRYADDMEVVAVSSFDEALAKLATS